MRQILIHRSFKSKRGAWDVFSDDPNDTAESLGLYSVPECESACNFAASHPELRYVGSEDNEHLYPNKPPEGVMVEGEKDGS